MFKDFFLKIGVILFSLCFCLGVSAISCEDASKGITQKEKEVIKALGEAGSTEMLLAKLKKSTNDSEKEEILMVLAKTKKGEPAVQKMNVQEALALKEITEKPSQMTFLFEKPSQRGGSSKKDDSSFEKSMQSLRNTIRNRNRNRKKIDTIDINEIVRFLDTRKLHFIVEEAKKIGLFSGVYVAILNPRKLPLLFKEILKSEDTSDFLRGRVLEILKQMGEISVPMLDELLREETHLPMKGEIEKTYRSIFSEKGVKRMSIDINRTNIDRITEVVELREILLVAEEAFKQFEHPASEVRQKLREIQIHVLGHPENVPSLFKEVFKSEKASDALRVQALEVLREAGEASVPVLLDLLDKETNDSMKKEILRNLVRIGKPAFRLMKEIIKDLDSSLKMNTLGALALKEMNKTYFKLVIEIIESEKTDDELRVKAVEFLKEIGGEFALSLLIYSR